MYNESTSSLPLVMHEGKTALISFNESEKPATEETPKMYTYESVRVPLPLSYPTIVTAIVREKYSADEVEAILLNGSDTPEHAQELKELQDWRKTAKQIAHQAIG